MLARRAGPLGALAAAVLGAHLWLADQALPDRIGDGAAEQRHPPRIDVAFVRQLQPQAPPGAAVPVLRAPRHAQLPAKAASASEPLERVATAVAELPLLGPEVQPEWLAITPPAVPARAASAAAAFEWPPSTRLSYRLTGHYRGPVEGQASVEWLRSGTRYQVFMDLSIGPSFAPLMSRRVSSDGEVTALGLQPRRYDEETKVVLMAPRRLDIQMEADTVRLADGSPRPRPPGLQDSASQFVQLTWLFTTQPELLQPGRSITLPLALPRQVEPWVYDVLDSVTLATPAGPVVAVHVKPRRVARPGIDMTAEIWVAPSLQYLPVRILIRQDVDTYIDLNIERLPEQAAPGK